MADTDVLFEVGQEAWLTSADSTNQIGAPYALLAKDTAVYLVKLGLGSQTTGTTVPAAALRFRAVDNFGGGSVTFKLYRVAGPWSEDTAWADRPDYTADSPISVAGTIAAGGLIEFDTTAFEALRLAVPSADYGYALVLDTAAVSGRIYTLTASDGVLGDTITARPTLTVTFSSIPSTPEDLQPAAGRAVGVATPVVRANFGDTDITAVQFQTKAANTGFDPETGFSSPTFDSGEFVTTDPSYDTSEGLFGGFGGSVSYWTIRVKNTDGNWSLWAEPESAYYDAKMSVTIMTPVTWSDPQVLAQWQTGGIQRAYRVRLFDDADHLTVRYDSGLLPGDGSLILLGTVHSHLIPYLLPDARPMYLQVDAFDDVDGRQATPGVPVYTTASSVVQYAQDLTVHQPDNVTASQIADSPFNNVYVTVNAAPDFFVLVRDGKHIKKVTPAQLAPPEEAEGGLTYTIVDYTPQPYQPHVYGVRSGNGDRTSKTTDYSIVGSEVSGIWVADPVRGKIAQCAGMDVGMQTNDQIGVLQALGDPYPSVLTTAIGQKAGTLGGVVTDFGGVSAADWVVTWRDIKNHPTEVQLAYGDTNFPARIWNVLLAQPTDRVSGFDKVVSFEFAQVGQEHLADEPADPGVYESVWDDFETGVSGNSLSGDTFIYDKTGGAQYLTGAAIHGSMGGDSSVGGGTWSYQLLNPYASGVSVGYKLTYPVSGRSVFHKLQTLAGDDLFTLRVKTDGQISLYDAAGTPVLQGKTNSVTAASTPLGIDMYCTWDGATCNVLYRCYFGSNFDTVAYQDVLSGSFPTDEAPYIYRIGNSGGEIRVQADDVRLSNNAGVAFAPVDPNPAIPLVNMTLVGGPATTSAYAATLLEVADAGLPGAPGDLIKLAVSTSPTMSSPTLTSAVAVSAASVVKHSVTGLTAATRYYCQPATNTGDLFGEVATFKTFPTGAFALKIAVVSCQDNGPESPGITLVMQDIHDWQPDLIFHLGDWGYWGGSLGASDSYLADIQKYRNSAAAKPSYRTAMQCAYLGAVTISDHELFDNSDYNNASNPNGYAFGDPGAGIFNSPMAARQILAHRALFPVQTWGDTRPTPKHRGYSYDIGSKVRVIVTDFRTSERNNIGDADGPGKQMWGAVQYAWLKATMDAARVNVLPVEFNWLADPAGANPETDKPWSYPYYQQDFADFVNATGAYSGGSTYKVMMVGGDRHFVGWLDGASNTMGGWPVFIGSGTYKNSLPMLLGETMTWQVGGDRDPDPSDSQKFPVCGYGQLTLSYNGSNTVTADVVGRAVSDATMNATASGVSPNITWDETLWTLSDVGTGTKSWTV